MSPTLGRLWSCFLIGFLFSWLNRNSPKQSAPALSFPRSPSSAISPLCCTPFLPPFFPLSWLRHPAPLSLNLLSAFHDTLLPHTHFPLLLTLHSPHTVSLVPHPLFPLPAPPTRSLLPCTYHPRPPLLTRFLSHSLVLHPPSISSLPTLLAEPRLPVVSLPLALPPPTVPPLFHLSFPPLHLIPVPTFYQSCYSLF